MKVTLQTVADAVGVSRSTVSNAYSRPDQLSPELRQRIMETAARLGYAGPDPTARSLRRGRAGAIGVLFTDTMSTAFADPYAVRFLRGLSEVAQLQRTSVLLVPLPVDDPAAAVDAVRDAAVDGFCVYCVPDWHHVMEVIESRGLPAVTNEQGASGAMFVGIDEAAAAEAAGAHLIALGHRRIAVIANWFTPDRSTRIVPVPDPAEVPYYVSRERLRGYHRAWVAAGLDWADVTVVNAEANERAVGAQCAALVLDRAPRPTAIVTFADVQALGVLDAITDRGLRPGRDVSVIGFDDIPEAATAGLTTIRQPAAERGRRAGQLLLEPPADPAARHVVLPTELIVRASTGPEGS